MNQEQQLNILNSDLELMTKLTKPYYKLLIQTRCKLEHSLRKRLVHKSVIKLEKKAPLLKIELLIYIRKTVVQLVENKYPSKIYI